ncbi:MAG: hypothetical protein ABI791_11040 [Acidobacteriota bacterium]
MRRVNGCVSRSFRFVKRGIVDAVPICFVLFLVFFATTAAQTPDLDSPAPPPLRKISKGEKEQLNSQQESKRRIEVALRLMDGRMKKAEELKAGENFDAMFLELGGFHGLMDNTLDFITRENRRTGKALNYFKKYELGLRSFTPRLELVRRDLPTRYDPYVLRLLRYMRDARSKAIEPFFDDTVIPNKP